MTIEEPICTVAIMHNQIYKTILTTQAKYFPDTVTKRSIFPKEACFTLVLINFTSTLIVYNLYGIKLVVIFTDN